MFTEGLDDNARRWVREEGISKKKESPFSMSPQKLQSETIFGLRNYGRAGGYGMPSPAKFHSGYLPSRVIPVSPAIPVGGNGGGSGSDMDLSSDSDDEVYGSRYSLDTSPQDDKIYNGTGPKSTNSVVRKINYANDPVHSELSSSRDRIERKQGRCLEKLGDDESSVSVASSEATSTLFRSNNDSVGHQGRCSSAGYYPSVHSQPNVKTTAKQVDLSVKDATILNCDYYCDMMYLLPYSSFLSLPLDNMGAGSESDSTISSETDLAGPVGIKFDTEEVSLVEKHKKEEMTLLDLYSDCGAMSTSLCLGSNMSGVNLVTEHFTFFKSCG